MFYMQCLKTTIVLLFDSISFSVIAKINRESLVALGLHTVYDRVLLGVQLKL